MFMTPCEQLQAVELVLLSAVKAVVDFMLLAIWDVVCFGVPQASGYKWQHILIATFSSQSLICLLLTVSNYYR